MKAIELVILIIAVSVLTLTLVISVIASDTSSFLNINLPAHGTQEPLLRHNNPLTDLPHVLTMAVGKIIAPTSLPLDISF